MNNAIQDPNVINAAFVFPFLPPTLLTDILESMTLAFPLCNIFMNIPLIISTKNIPRSFLRFSLDLAFLGMVEMLALVMNCGNSPWAFTKLSKHNRDI